MRFVGDRSLVEGVQSLPAPGVILPGERGIDFLN